jgi:hypothetical protein
VPLRINPQSAVDLRGAQSFRREDNALLPLIIGVLRTILATVATDCCEKTLSLHPWVPSATAESGLNFSLPWRDNEPAEIRTNLFAGSSGK